MKNNIYIRADGSSAIGLGHIVRCEALAHMLKEYFKITFVCKEIPEQSKNNLQMSGFELINISSEDDFFKKIFSDDIIILDGYGFDINYQKKIKKIGCKLVCIDDLHDKEFVADLIINHAPGVESKDYIAQPYTQFALGLKHTLLRPVFLTQAKKERKIEKIKTIFICFGGSDIKNLTKSTLEIVLANNEFKNIIIVTGSLYNKLKELNQLINCNSRIKHYHAIDENQMLSLLKDSDLAIVPTSSILFETLAAGCKIISGMYVENQKILFEQFKLFKVFESAKYFEKKDVKIAIKNSLRNTGTQIRIIDGESGKRNLSKIMQLKTIIRDAKDSDCKLLFEWANNIEVRQNAISKDQILWENHVDWFNSKINSRDSKIFILEFYNMPVGQIRYDRKDDYWVIDYSVDLKHRGIGFGKLLIEKTLLFFEKNKIRAMVKKENLASANIFVSLNFNFVKPTTMNNEYYHVFEHQ